MANSLPNGTQTNVYFTLVLTGYDAVVRDCPPLTVYDVFDYF